MHIVTLLSGIGGIALLYFGAEFLVKGGSSIALKMKISPLVIGLTLVAYATSAPELVVSVDSAIKGMGDISLGNVIGSNICNIALILGLCALITPIQVNKKLLKFDIWILIVSALLLAGSFYLFKGVNRLAGAGLFTASAAYTVWSIYASRRDEKSSSQEQGGKIYPLYLAIFMTLAGIAALVGGAKLFVYAATILAKALNISDAVIGLTVVAVGTSLPELATSVVAAVRKEQDIAIGNVIGSNIFNVLSILGIVPLISPITAVGIGCIDIIFMTALSVILYLFMLTGSKISRWEGLFLLMSYIAYTIYLII